jgi:uncharacterized protein YoxC
MDYVNIVTMIALAALTGMGSYIMKTVTSRIDTLEQKMDNTVTEQEVRQLLDDKINPMKDDIKDIKYSIDKLFSFFIRGLDKNA